MNIKKIISLMCAVVVFGSLSAFNSAASTVKCTHGYFTFKDHIMTGGVGDYGNYRRYYWVSTSSDAVNQKMLKQFRQGTYDNIANAVDKWVNTSPDYPNVTTSISFRETKTKADAMVEIHGFAMGVSEGRTEYSRNSKSIDPVQENWGWAKILIDPYTTSDMGERAQTGLVAHEFGHAMGLSHQENRPNTSIMYPTRDRYMEDGKTKRNGPSATDCKTINHLYS